MPKGHGNERAAATLFSVGKLENRIEGLEHEMKEMERRLNEASLLLVRWVKRPWWRRFLGLGLRRS